jgi:hypothetical protein
MACGICAIGWDTMQSELAGNGKGRIKVNAGVVERMPGIFIDDEAGT